MRTKVWVAAAVSLSACLSTVQEDAGNSTDAGLFDAGIPARDAGTPPIGVPIGIDGGTITLDGGIVLSFPPNALVNTVFINAEPFAGGPPGFERLSDGYTLSPEGQRFERAVAITFDTTGIPASRTLTVATAPSGSTQFEFIPTTRTANTAVAFLWHFSTVQLVADAGADAGTDDAGSTDAGISQSDAGLCGALPTDIATLDAGPGCRCRPIGAPCFDSTDCAVGFCLITSDPPAGYGRICSVYCGDPDYQCPCNWICNPFGGGSEHLCDPPHP
ncbi:MAG: hypothetical protein JNM17_13605 [Archangium sp.]|nr:hypothetical protein [Archangium sp.]